MSIVTESLSVADQVASIVGAIAGTLSVMLMIRWRRLDSSATIERAGSRLPFALQSLIIFWQPMPLRSKMIALALIAFPISHVMWIGPKIVSLQRASGFNPDAWLTWSLEHKVLHICLGLEPPLFFFLIATFMLVSSLDRKPTVGIAILCTALSPAIYLGALAVWDAAMAIILGFRSGGA